MWIFFSDEMAGSITLSPANSDTVAPEGRTCWGVKRPVLLQRRVQLKPPPVHMYVCMGGRCHLLNLNQCFSMSDFTLNYNEEHVLITDITPNIHRGVWDDGILKIDAEHPPVGMCYKIRLQLPRTVVNVGQDTSLYLLLNMGCIHVDELALTRPEFIKLLEPHA